MDCNPDGPDLIIPRVLALWPQSIPLAWTLDPLDMLARWPADRAVVMLHSGRLHPRYARWSLLAVPADFQSFPDPPVTSDIQYPASDIPPSPFPRLRELLHRPGPWLGYLSYDLGRCIERLPTKARIDRAWPVIELAHIPGALVFDHLHQQWHACGTYVDPAPRPELADADLLPATIAATPAQPGVTRAAYESAVQRALDYIAAGDIFQVNLAQRFTSVLTGSSPLLRRALYRNLARISPAWYGAYLELPEQRALASTSPELFLDVTGTDVVTRPIKGTRPAAVDPAELLHSAKDAAELHMIVDLLRNDLGRVCAYGSIHVAQARDIESHPTVHHGVATVTGRLHPTKDIVDLLRAVMPGGSITGAPKVRAMQIIDELEPVRRGPYCGTIGLLSPQRILLNIAIRTFCLQPDPQNPTRTLGDFHVGGGIVADSSPAAEYDETLAKAHALLHALHPPEVTREQGQANPGKRAKGQERS